MKMNTEYENITKDILKNEKFQELKKLKHHHTNRFEHSKRVSLNSYKICKILHLDYVSAARGGLLHDFFFEEYSKPTRYKLIKEHPSIAISNSQKYFKLSNKEKNIIESHMYPLNIKSKPNCLESVVVSFVDKVSCLYEESLAYIRR